MMDSFSLPPEITSALIHAGPGAESLIEASGAWQQLGAEMEETIPTYASVVSSLTQVWRGPSSATMADAVDPFLNWMRNIAQQCKQLASSVLAAASAFTQAQATVVQPAVVAANRARLAQLLATNLLGVNLPAIAQTEDQYQTMWANNSSAMSRYQAATAQALQLPQFSSPPSIASPTAAATQAAAVPAAAAPAAVDPLGLNIFAPNTDTTGVGLAGLLNLFSGSSNSAFGSFLNSNFLTTAVINSIFSSGFPINLLSLVAQVQTAQGVSGLGGDVGQGLSEGEGAIGELGLGTTEGAGAGLSAAEPAAAMGVGVSLGKLTAPPAVVGIMPSQPVPVQLASAASPLPDGDGGLPFLPPLMPPPITAGSGWRKRKQQKYDDLEIGMELKGTVVPRNPPAG
jgi:PPE-repeat protein